MPMHGAIGRNGRSVHVWLRVLTDKTPPALFSITVVRSFRNPSSRTSTTPELYTSVSLSKPVIPSRLGLTKQPVAPSHCPESGVDVLGY